MTSYSIEAAQRPEVIEVLTAPEDACQRARVLCRLRPWRGRRIEVWRSDGVLLGRYQDARSCEGGAKGMYR